MTRPQRKVDLKSARGDWGHDYVSLDPNRRIVCAPIENHRDGGVDCGHVACLDHRLPVSSRGLAPWLMADAAEAGWPCVALLKHANAVAFRSMIEGGSIWAGEDTGVLPDEAPDGLELETESFESRLDAGYFVL